MIVSSLHRVNVLSYCPRCSKIHGTAFYIFYFPVGINAPFTGVYLSHLTAVDDENRLILALQINWNTMIGEVNGGCLISGSRISIFKELSAPMCKQLLYRAYPGTFFAIFTLVS